MAGLTRRIPLVYESDFRALLLGSDILEFLHKVRRNLSQRLCDPKGTFMPLRFKRFKGNPIISVCEVMSKFPVEILPLVGNLAVSLCKVELLHVPDSLTF